MLNNLFIALFSLFLSTYSTFATAQKVELKTELSEAEIKTLNAREFIVRHKEVPDSAWPEITYYILIDATPLECMGIFSAIDYQKNYIPKMLRSTPIKHVSPTEVLAVYELRVPFPLSNPVYTHGSKVMKYGDDYELTWYLVESTSTEDVKGSAYFTNWEGKTLFRYRSFIKPKSALGSLVKKFMFKDVEATIVAIRDHIEKLKIEKSPLLPKYSEFISRSLNGEFVYQSMIDKK